MTQQEFLNALPAAVEISGFIDTRVVYVDGKELKPDESQKIRNHSPDGFNWGYGGSGPAQFALALLLLYVDQETAQRYYQRFKFAWVASLPQSNFGDCYNLRAIMRKVLMNKPDVEPEDPELYTTKE
jgi:hypothetical protein